MALTPDFVKYGEASLTATSATGGTATLTATHNNGTTWPNAHVETTSITVNVTEVTAGSGPPSPYWGIAVVEDATDAAGDYTAAGAVLAWVDIGTAPTPATPIVITGLNKGGTYRLVVTAGDSAANSQSINNVTTGATSTEYHFDSDDNSLRGTLAPTIGTTRVGVAGHRMEATAITPTAGNWKYGQTNQIAVSLRPAGDNAAALINPKNFKVVLSTDAAGSTRPDGTYSVTPNTTGDATATNIRVDTDFNQTLGGVAHYVQLGVNNTLGDNSTPTGERADIYQVAGATQEGTNTNQRSAIIFADGATTTVISDSQVRSDTADVTISAAIQIFEDAGLVTPGVAPFATSGYATRQDIFKRKGPTLLTDAVPYLQCYVFDAYDNPLINTPVTGRVLRTINSSQENTQSLTTDANGRVRFNYTIPNNAPAFTQMVKPGATRQSNGHVATGPDSTIAWPYTYTFGNPQDPTTYGGPFYGYPRDVEIEGRVFTTKEPKDTDVNVFGINSEGFVEGIWSGSLTAADLDVNGVPQGAGRPSQILGSGSLKVKPTSKIEPASLRVDDLGRHALRDGAGREIDVISDHWFQRTAVFNDTTDSVIQGPIDLNDAQTALENSLAYNANNNSLDTIDPPTDPASLKYYTGLADTTTQRTSFDVSVSGSEPVVGFTNDVGNFGYRLLITSFQALDSSVAAIMTTETIQSDPVLTRRFKFRAIRVAADVAVNPTTGFNPVETDSAPVYAVFAQDSGTGAIQLIDTGLMTVVGSEPSADWYFDYTLPLNYRMIKVYAVATVAGSPIIGGDKLPVQIGYEFDAIGFITGFFFK